MRNKRISNENGYVILDFIDLSGCRLFLAGSGFPGFHLYDWPCRALCVQRPLLCGHICPRGSYYDRLVARFSLNRPIPGFLRTPYFRTFMVLFIFTMFGVQMYFAWGDWNAMGRVFWLIILVTTIVGTVLGIVYSPRAWCTFCPMGSLSAWVAPRKRGGAFRNIHVADACILCKRCARVCPMQLKPYEAKGAAAGLMDPDCIKCGKCVSGCPKKVMEMK